MTDTSPTNLRARFRDLGVALITSYPVHTGGAHSHMRSLHQGLSRLGARPSLHFGGPRNLADAFHALLVGQFRAERSRLEYKRRALRRFGTAMNTGVDAADILHFHDPLASAVTTTSLPTVLTVHGPASREAKMTFPAYSAYVGFVRDLEAQGYRNADCIIAVDTGQKEILINDFQVAASKIHVILNAVDTRFFSPLPSATDGGDYVIVPRRLVSKNGVSVAIEAMREVGGKIRLLIAGDGPDMQSLRTQARQLGVAQRVTFLGSVPHGALLSLLQRALAVVVPSVPVAGVVEASSIAVLEGMACGRPVIASNIGGLAEMIRDGDNGFLFPAGDASRLASRITELVNDTDARQRIQRRAREYVISNHSIDDWIQKTVQVYDAAGSSSAKGTTGA